MRCLLDFLALAKGDDFPSGIALGDAGQAVHVPQEKDWLGPPRNYSQEAANAVPEAAASLV